MASTKEIKRRIKSVKNTKKITKAMELVAASKMKRAVANTLASRLYAEYSWDILISIGSSLEEISHPLFEQREVKNILLILITSNRGLCGAYNAQVIKETLAFLRKEKGEVAVDIITVGKKGDVAMRRIGQKVLASFLELPEQINFSSATPIFQIALDEYISNRYDKVLVAYTDFVSALSQKPHIKQIFPVSKMELKDFIGEMKENFNAETKSAIGGSSDASKEAFRKKTDYLFEGDKKEFIGYLAEKLSKMQIYQMLLESNASEQSSRMVAMKNASEASEEMINDLTLVFNKARQASITQEISEISAGMASVG